METGDLDDLIAAALAGYQQHLEQGAPVADTIGDDEPLPAAVADRLRRGKDCLELLVAIKHQSPRWTASTRPPIAAEPDAPRGRTVGRFQLLDQLGSGGFGIVYRALDPYTQREVAIKIPRVEALASADLVRRFELEAQAAAKLNHPNIVTVLEAGSDGLLPYIVSVYYPGQTLAQWLRDHAQQLSPRQAAQWAATLAEAVEHAHQQGVLHRDIKPANVMLVPAANGDAQSADELVPKLMDFGLAKLESSAQAMTQTGNMLGTIRYMSPEQAHGRLKAIGPASDVYSLGAVLYELLSGRPPFADQTDVDVLRKLGAESPSRISSTQGRIPIELNTICLKCLQQEPRARYASAGKLALDLRRFLAGEPIAARPASAVEVAWKWARRRPASAALLAMTVASVLAALVGVSIHSLRVEEFARRVQASEERAQSLLYSADMQIAQQAIESNSLEVVREILQRHREQSHDLREFSWSFLASVLSRDVGRLTKQPGDVYGLAYAPDGRRLVTSGRDGHLRVWKLPERALERDLPTHLGEAGPICLSHDGSLLVSGGDDGRVVIRRARDWALVRVLDHPSQNNERPEIAGIAFSLDDTRLYVAVGRDLYVWDHGQGQVTAHREAAHDSWIRSLDLSPDGKRLVTVRGDLRLFDSRDLSPQGQFNAPDGRKFVNAQFVTSERLAAADIRGGLYLFDADGSPRQPSLVTAYEDGKVLDVSPDGQLLLTAGTDGVVQLNHLTQGVLAVHHAHAGRIWSGQFAPDGNSFAITSAEGEVSFWNMPESNRWCQPDGSTEYYAHPKYRLKAITYSRDGRWQAVCGDGEESILIDRQTLRVLLLPTKPILGPCLCFTADSKHLISVNKQGELQQWEAATGRLLATRRAPAEVVSASLSPAGDRLLLAVEDDQSAQVYSWPAFELLHAWADPKRAISCAFYEPDGRHLVVGRIGQLCRFDAESFTKRWQIGQAGSEFHDVDFLPARGELIVAEGRDGAAIRRISDGALVARLAGHRDKVVTVAASPDGRNLASLCNQRVLRVWDRDTLQTHLIFRDKAPAGSGSLRFSPSGDELGIAQFRAGGDISAISTRVHLATPGPVDTPPLDMRRTTVVVRTPKLFPQQVTWSRGGARWLMLQGGDPGGRQYVSLSHPEDPTDWLANWKLPRPATAGGVANDGRYFLVETDGTVQWYRDGDPLGINYAAAPNVSLVLLSRDDSRLAYVTSSEFVVLEAASGREIARSTLAAPIATLSPFGEHEAIVGTAAGELQVIDMRDGRLVRTATGRRSPILSVEPSADGRLLAIVTADHRLELVSAETLATVRSQAIPSQVRRVFFCEHDQWLLCDRAGLPLIHAPTGQNGVYAPLWPGAQVLGVSPDGRQINFTVARALGMVRGDAIE